MIDRQLERALIEDGKKLRQLTGQNHGPWFPCGLCGGWGHLEFTNGVEMDCPICNGTGWIENLRSARIE
jgi:hypothetical protein